MRSRNNNFKVKGVTQNVLRGAGFVSVGVLTLLGILAISPITNKTDAANGWDEELKNYRESASTVTLSMDSGTNSVVNAGNTNTNVGVVKRTASVTLGNTNGYSVYIRANSANLTGSNSSNTIPSVTSNSTLSQMTDKWGWNGSVGDNVTDCSLSDVFKQMTTSNQTLGTGGAISSGTKKVTMCFGTRVSEAKVADTYSNTVTLSVVAEPGRTAAFGGITNMQQMTASICSAAPYHETAQLTDTRDNKKYWVTKMLDGNCWMSQNLDLDLSSSNIKASDSDVSSDWTGGRMATSISQSGLNSQTGTYAWDLGTYVSIAPTVSESCSSNSAGLSDCHNQFIEVGSRTPSTNPNFYKTYGATYTSTEYDAHYLVGNHYQWNAATAGTGASTATNADAAGSVCPKNWKLPVSHSTKKNSFAYLLQQYGVSGSLSGISGVNDNAYDIVQSPLFFVFGGAVLDAVLSSAGGSGLYWSSRAYASSPIYAYHLTLISSINTVKPSDTNNMQPYYGYSLRCLVQTP